jgi:hypothetical protein
MRRPEVSAAALKNFVFDAACITFSLTLLESFLAIFP